MKIEEKSPLKDLIKDDMRDLYLKHLPYPDPKTLIEEMSNYQFLYDRLTWRLFELIKKAQNDTRTTD